MTVMIGTHYTHMATQNVYELVGLCIDEASLDTMVLYRSIEGGDTVVWSRKATDFFDGRFEWKAQGGEKYNGQYNG